MTPGLKFTHFFLGGMNDPQSFADISTFTAPYSTAGVGLRRSPYQSAGPSLGFGRGSRSSRVLGEPVGDTSSFYMWNSAFSSKQGYASSRNERLLNDTTFSDLTLHVEDQIIKAHKAVLACSSPVFRAMFEHQMLESKGNTIRIGGGATARSVRAFLRYIYVGNLDDVHFTTSIWSQLLELAAMYDVEDLKLACFEKLAESLCITNIMKLLVLAHLHNGMQLKFRCFQASYTTRFWKFEPTESILVSFSRCWPELTRL